MHVIGIMGENISMNYAIGRGEVNGRGAGKKENTNERRSGPHYGAREMGEKVPLEIGPHSVNDIEHLLRPHKQPPGL